MKRIVSLAAAVAMAIGVAAGSTPARAESAGILIVSPDAPDARDGELELSNPTTMELDPNPDVCAQAAVLFCDTFKLGILEVPEWGELTLDLTWAGSPLNDLDVYLYTYYGGTGSLPILLAKSDEPETGASAERLVAEVPRGLYRVVVNNFSGLNESYRLSASVVPVD